MNDSPHVKSRRWRRYLRLNVRTAILVVLAIGGGMGWLVHSARVQREAVAAIEGGEGAVIYRESWIYARPAGLRSNSVWQKWLVNTLGVDYFGHVVAASIRWPPSEAHLPAVGRLTDLEELRLRGMSFSKEELKHLAGLDRLQKLGLGYSHIDDMSLSALKDLSSLRELSLRTCEGEVTDTGLANLAQLRRLRVLRLPTCEVTDRGLLHLKGLTEIESLELQGCDLTERGLVHLVRMNKLTSLGFSLPDLNAEGLAGLNALTTLKELKLTLREPSDDGLVALERLPCLKELTLRSTKVSRAGLVHLRKLTGLRYLIVDEAAISDAELTNFQRSLPSTGVLHPVSAGDWTGRGFYARF